MNTESKQDRKIRLQLESISDYKFACVSLQLSPHPVVSPHTELNICSLYYANVYDRCIEQHLLRKRKKETKVLSIPLCVC